jgi:hypothetical protein
MEREMKAASSQSGKDTRSIFEPSPGNMGQFAQDAGDSLAVLSEQRKRGTRNSYEVVRRGEALLEANKLGRMGSDGVFLPL